MIAAAFLRRTKDWFAAIAADRARMRFLRFSLVWTAVAWFVVTVVVNTISHTYKVGLDLEEVRCMPWRVYVLKFERPQVARGHFVAYRDFEGVMGPNYAGRMLGKMIAGVPGDRVVVKDDFAWVNGWPVGKLIHNARLGRAPGAFDRDEIVPEGKVFVVGTEPRSYDSRYWGFLGQHALIGSLSPLF